MAAQQVAIMETITHMKRAMKRRPSDADSDNEIQHHTNRGNKLKRSASHVQQERLDDTGGLAYRRKINHAGYFRNTISTNPALVDEDGDIYSPTSSDDEAGRYREPAEENPFGDVRLEHLLRPLTSPAELADHPGLSVAYKSKALTQMAEEAEQMLRRERASLWKAKRLLQRLRGDSDWVPSSVFETENDKALLDDSASIADQSAVPSIITDQPMLELEPPSLQDMENGFDALDPLKPQVNGADSGNHDSMEVVDAVDMATAVAEGTALANEGGAAEEGNAQIDVLPTVNGESQAPPGDEQNAPTLDQTTENDGIETLDPAPNPIVAGLADREAGSDTASQSNGGSMHAMTTRRAARARSPAEPSDRTPSPSPSDSASVPAVNPWFIAPSTCLFDRDLGLPAGEADETRKLLFSYCQKQEQIVRSLESLHSGLQKADRLRQDVWRNAKAEGHMVPDGRGNMVTEMSDGEDWYDPSDYNLQPWELKDGKLEKGKDEVEDVEEERGRRPGRGRRVNRM